MDGSSEFAQDPQMSCFFLLLSHIHLIHSRPKSLENSCHFENLGEDLSSSVHQSQNWEAYFPRLHRSFWVRGLCGAMSGHRALSPSYVTLDKLLTFQGRGLRLACLNSPKIIKDGQHLLQIPRLSRLCMKNPLSLYDTHQSFLEKYLPSLFN